MSTLNTLDSQENLYCPHFQNVNEKTLRRLFSKVAAVRSDDKELFEFTHRPIDVFRSPQGTQAEEQVVSEDAVCREFSDERIGNFTVVIEGEVGTGKSELCAYISHYLRDEGNRPILHVDKDDDLMTLLSERIPGFYEEHFDEQLPGASNFKQLKRDLKENGSVVANNATSGAILNLRARGYSVDASGKEDQIRKHVQKQLALLVEKGQYAKEIKFVTEEAYKRNDPLQVIASDVNVEEAVTAFNTELWRVIRDRYQTASLDDVLEQVGAKFTDTRPVIIFEDFAIAAMEGQQLRNYMERDKSEDNWDFVVAGTRDSTQVLHTQTAEDRFEFYRTNKQNSNSVLFLDEDSAVDFIRPYLGYFKSFDDSVQYDRSGDGLDLGLQPAPNGSICAECGFCDESFRDLFPFNESSLRRIYTGLSADQQSPREYVMTVFDVLRDYYEGYVDAPSDADGLKPLRSPVSAATEVYEDAQPLAELARWYGVSSSDGIAVDARFVAVFGYQDLVNSIDEVEQTEDTVLIPTEISGKTRESSNTGSEAGDVNGSTSQGDEETPSVHSRAERLLSEHLSNVPTWQQNPSEFKHITYYLKVGLHDAIERLTDNFKLFDGMGLRYNLSSEKDPFVFKSLAKAPDQDQIVVDPMEFRISDLHKLLEFGIYRDVEKKGAGADYENLLKSLGTQLTSYARQWRNKVRENNLNSETRFFKKHVDSKFEDYALAGYAYAVLLDSPFEKLNAETLSKRFAQGESYTLDSQLSNELRAELSTEDFEAVESFIENAEKYREMVSAFFGASANTLDVATIRSRLRAKPPYKVLQGLGRGQINRVSLRVRFDTNSKIRDMANEAYDLHRALEVASKEYRGEVVKVINDELVGVSLNEIETLVDTLRTYDSVDAEMLETLGKFVALSPKDLDAAVDAAALAEELITGTNDDHLQGSLISLKLASTEAYQRYDNLTIVGGGGTSSEFADQFQEVGEHYVE